MRKHKKILIVVVVAVAILAASLGTVAIVQADDEPVATSSTADSTTIWDRIASILNQNTGSTVTGDDLKTASDEAHQQIRDEALDSRLQKLVENGKITQEQADEYKAWLESRPDTIISDEYKAWLEAQPGDMPFGLGGGRMPAMERGFCDMGRMFRH